MPAKQTSRPEAVDAYLQGLPDDQREALEQIRSAVRAAAPEATELISYRIPTFKNEGRPLVAYAAFKGHLSFFPMSSAVIETLRDDLDGFELHGKTTIRFSPDRPLPAKLVRRVVKARIAENAGRESGRAAKLRR